MSEVYYHVWAFRRFNSCYDCGQAEHIEVEPNAAAVQLSEQEFHAFQKGLASQGRYDNSYVYLYRQVGENALTPKIQELVKIGTQVLLEEVKRDEERKRKAAARAEKAKDAATKKAEKAAKEKRKLYEQLKAEFEK